MIGNFQSVIKTSVWQSKFFFLKKEVLIFNEQTVVFLSKKENMSSDLCGRAFHDFRDEHSPVQLALALLSPVELKEAEIQ